METVVAILLWGAALSLAVGAAKAVVGLVRAPEGYQNHDGFHYTK